MAKEKNVDETMTEIVELVEMQQKALKTSDSLLHLKDCMIEILEAQKRIYIKENKVFKICFFGLVTCNILSVIISFFA
jgi:hypothetical protein